MFATETQNCRAQRAPHVESENPRTRIAAKLQSQCGQQHRLAHAGRPHHQGMTDITDMGDQPERRGAIGARDNQRRAVQMNILHRPRPDRRHWQQVRQVQRRDDGLAHIGVGIARD